MRRILKSVNNGKTRSILARIGVTVANALFTAVITVLFGLASGNSENTFTRMVSIKSNILFVVTAE
jgi:hypothetical protein